MQRRAAGSKDAEKKDAGASKEEEIKSTPKPASPSSSGSVTSPALINITVHSLLMVAVPFSIFFASINGIFDPLYKATFGIPEERNKAIPAALLAVLSVQFVIASFVIHAFKEDAEPARKKTE